MFGAKKNTTETLNNMVKGNKGKGKTVAKVIVIVLILFVLGNESYYSIQEEEQAVVCTFGSPKAVTTPWSSL